jgi:hypothetical protein
MNSPGVAPFGSGAGIVTTAGIAAVDPVTLTPLFEDFDAQARWVLHQPTKRFEAGTNSRNLLRVE